MRLLRVSAAGLAMLVVASAEAGAQDSTAARNWAFGALGGVSDVTGAFRSRLNNGVELGALAQYPLAVRRLAVRSDIMLHYIWQESRGTCVSPPTPMSCARDYSWSHIWSVSTVLVARLNDPATRWSPYILGGGAVYEAGGSREHIWEFDPSWYGLQAGVGFDVRKEGRILFVEMRQMNISPGGVVLVTVGVRR